ncbi:MAG: hypothetical protein ACFFHV_16415, partial [Promethearchaeota archaeon]
MKLINNYFNDIEVINGFTKEELIEIKTKLLKLNSDKADQTEIDEYLSSKFSSSLIEFYSNYLNELKTFISNNLKTTQESKNRINFYHYYIKSGIKNEIKKIINNLLNFKLNGQNTKRFLKSSSLLDELLIKIQGLINDYEDLTSNLKISENQLKGIYDNYTYIWIEVNKLKNLYFKIDNLTEDITKWEEFREFYDNFKKIMMESTNKKERKKKDFAITVHFNDIYRFFSNRKNGDLDFYKGIVAFLYDKNIIEEYKGNIEDIEEFVNVLDRKEVKNKIKSLMNPIIKNLVEDKLKEILNEIIELDKTYKLDEGKKEINLTKLLEQKFGTYLPQIIDYYLKGLENKYQATISDLKEYDEFKNIAHFYSDKIDILNSLMEGIEKYFINYDLILKPYEDITTKHKQIFANLYSEIERRKNEYLYYLKTIRRERLRDN